MTAIQAIKKTLIILRSLGLQRQELLAIKLQIIPQRQSGLQLLETIP